MEDDRNEACADPPAPATPHGLARLAPAVDVVDPTTLEQNMANWHQMRALLTAYITEHMQEGIDYYTLTIGGKVSKPSLSKAGSEKFLSLFNVHAKFRKDEETWEMLGRPAGVICYVCELYTKRGEFVGEGRGAREVLKEKDINKAIKMAQKCLGGTTPVLIKEAYGITRTLLNKLDGRDLTNLWIAGPHATWRKIMRVERQPLGPVRRLLFRDGLQVTASLDHRWPLKDGRLVETRDLQVGDCIQRSPLPRGDGQAVPDLTWMAGLFVAEDDLMPGRGMRFALHAEEDAFAAHLARIGAMIGAHGSNGTNGNKRTVYLYGKGTMGLITHFAVRKVGKRFETYAGRIKSNEPRYSGRDLGMIMDIGVGEEVTYEIEVDGDHLFCLANGLVTHNSAQIDAVLRTGALSDAFTQDLEDAEEPEEPLVRQQKHRIVALLKLLGAGAADKAGYEEVVQQYTGLALVPALYPDIIQRLEARVTERLRTRAARGGKRTGVA